MSSPFSNYLPSKDHKGLFLRTCTPVDSYISSLWNPEGQGKIITYSGKYRIDGKTRNKKEITIMSTADLEKVLSYHEFNGKKVAKDRSKEFFRGIIGERLMNAHFEMFLHYLKQKTQSIHYTLFSGEKHNIIRLTEVEDMEYLVLTYGSHNNVKILEVSTDRVLKDAVSRKYDSIRVKGEIDLLASLEFIVDENGVKKTYDHLLIGEAKTGKVMRNFITGTTRKANIKERIFDPLAILFPNYHMTLGLMPLKREAFAKKRRLTKRIEEIYNYLETINIDFLIMPFNETRGKIDELADHVYADYQSIIGKDPLKVGTAYYNNNKLIIQDENGNYVAVLKKTSKGWKKLNS